MPGSAEVSVQLVQNQLKRETCQSNKRFPGSVNNPVKRGHSLGWPLSCGETRGQGQPACLFQAFFEELWRRRGVNAAQQKRAAARRGGDHEHAMTQTFDRESAPRRGTDFAAFLRGVWRNPRAVSSPTPSSGTLARAIAAEVDPQIPGTLVELGAGTGAITKALLARGFAPHRILAVEYEPVLVAALRRNCPGVRIFCDDAFRFEALLAPEEPVCAVVCGLPLLHFPQETRQRLLTAAMARQGRDRRFVQLSYSFRPPIIPPSEGISLQGTLIWKNFPPAHVWSYRVTL
jgi:phosphatidylethanolamine/phosphatidyl-N-methylethanolamine N-methyltransferase